ncbi:polysaccharide biosynthesis UDP-hexose transferase UppI [Agrobacterium genomosp. 13]|uniref:Beta-xylanase n=1 Tax=Agrobacterium genomosp. 13 str. CFBP 6927 TaxID=1183428 RepID=A0ABM9VF31_9HYPH|nr:polysaccharide biosynthesis UDP-hexose transferase UppI [Agrobacterium genomosp. 13]CUX29313.1 endo-1,4-beta-xylanase [Agrobacterium genomosp. 13 str. CFBP 6927]
MRIGRRNFLGGAACVGLLHGMAGQGFAAQKKAPVKTAPYGAAVYLPDLTADSRIGEAVVKYCSRITPVTEMKWEVMRPSEEVFDFAAADALANFARQHNLSMHGHPLIWYASNAPWLAGVRGAKVEKLMETHIVKVMERYKDVIHSWDVVNEPIPDVPGNVRSRRDAWYYGAGPDAIKKAFEIAHAVDPKAQLVLNEYDVEFSVEKSPAKRGAFRNLILELLEKGAPINAVGLQGHLRGGWPIAKDELAAFTKEMRSYGLAVLVTELDVMDQTLPAPEAERDMLINQQVRDFLEAASEGGPLSSITTWGISDQYTWIRWAYPRRDGTVNRPLPLDWSFNEKPMMAVINEFRNRGA